MKKLATILFLILIIYCGKKSSNPSHWEYYFQGTVYLRGNPCSNVLVNLAYRDTGCQIPSEWRTEKETRTDKDGKYEFTLTASNETGYRWRARVQHPESGVWTEWKDGGMVSAGASGAGTLNFYLE